MSSVTSSSSSNETSQPRTITLRIARSNPQSEKDANTITSGFDEFDVQYEKWTTVLDAILEVKKKLDHSIAVRYSCRQATCGSCGMMINGRPRLACFTKIDELDSSTVTTEPLQNYPVIRDLAVGFDSLFDKHRSINPYLDRDDTELDNITDPRSLKEYPQSPKELESYIQFANCIKCGLCNAACPTMATDSTFLGPQALAQAYRYVGDSRDKGKDSRLKVIDDSHGIWRCHFAGSCSQVCPKGVDPAMGIQMLRGYMLGFRK